MSAARTLLFIACKALPASKSRLAGLLRPDDRAALAAALYRRTLRIAAQVRPHGGLVVVSPDAGVLAQAEEQGVEGLPEPACDGLNGVAGRMRAVAAKRGFESYAYLPIDLPRLVPEDLATMLAGRPGVLTLVPDRHRGGTNGMVVPVDSPFRSLLGADSFRRHLDQARALGMQPRTPALASMAFDLDTVRDFHDFVRTDLLAPGRLPALALGRA